MLLELINEKRIQITDRSLSFREAVDLACAPMIADGSVEPRYAAAVVDAVDKHGPYIVLADRFAMPHARPEDGVNRLDMSLLLSKKAVDVCGESVNLFIALAAADSRSHLDAMAELVGLIGRDGAIDEICALESEAEILEYIKKNVGEEG